MSDTELIFCSYNGIDFSDNNQTLARNRFSLEKSNVMTHFMVRFFEITIYHKFISHMFKLDNAIVMHVFNLCTQMNENKKFLRKSLRKIQFNIF